MGNQSMVLVHRIQAGGEMKTLLRAPQICANVYANGSADRFDGLAGDDGLLVHVEHHMGEFEPPERPFWIIDKLRTVSIVTLVGSDGVTLTIPAGFDITDLFTRGQIQEMEEDLTRMLLKGDEF